MRFIIFPLLMVTCVFADGFSPMELAKVVPETDAIIVVEITENTQTIEHKNKGEGFGMESVIYSNAIKSKMLGSYVGGLEGAVFNTTYKLVLAKGVWLGIPGSGLEGQMKPGEKYVFLLKERDGRHHLQRAEKAERLDEILVMKRGPRRVEKTRAGSLFSEYLKRNGEPPDDFTFNLSPFGKTTWIVSCYLKGLHPAIPSRYVMNARGEVRELTLDSMNVVFMNEYPSSPEKEDRDKLIKAFTKLHTGETVAIISETSDIPGYDKASLDADIADAVRSPFSSGNLTTVVYTYQQVGGIVSRYRFVFETGKTFRKVECAILGEDIGEAQYYE